MMVASSQMAQLGTILINLRTFIFFLSYPLSFQRGTNRRRLNECYTGVTQLLEILGEVITSRAFSFSHRGTMKLKSVGFYSQLKAKTNVFLSQDCHGKSPHDLGHLLFYIVDP